MPLCVRVSGAWYVCGACVHECVWLFRVHTSEIVCAHGLNGGAPSATLRSVKYTRVRPHIFLVSYLSVYAPSKVPNGNHVSAKECVMWHLCSVEKME